MSGRIEIQMFNEISGNVRGIVLAFFAVNGKQEKRICHAYITTNGPDISIDIPRYVPANQIEDMLKLVGDFYKKVETL